MSIKIFLVQSYFDGQKHHTKGPYTIITRSGWILEIEKGDILLNQADLTEKVEAGAAEVHRSEFLMPGLVEGHSHLFLDGLELDFEKRKDYLSASWDEMTAVGNRNIAGSLSAGITLIRDGGDRYGINHHLRADSANRAGLKPEIRSPGKALRKEGGYGGFIGIAVKDAEGILEMVHEIAESADDLKILLTGIIDFEKGEVKGSPQFSLGEISLMVETASRLGLMTYAHCSGIEGLIIAAEAGVNSIEHGFFMNRDILTIMADKNISWVPTFSPVYFQYQNPELAGWNVQTVSRLDAILNNHFRHIAFAHEMGVPIIAGSDAGSYGVPHGRGLIDELFFLDRAGIPLTETLSSATSVPRRIWNCESADIIPGNRINFLELKGSPFINIDNLNQSQSIFHHTTETIPGKKESL
jgi:imidazolonepropionase-like amidohydrolase